jgi:hypothetical protein
MISTLKKISKTHVITNCLLCEVILRVDNHQKLTCKASICFGCVQSLNLESLSRFGCDFCQKNHNLKSILSRNTHFNTIISTKNATNDENTNVTLAELVLENTIVAVDEDENENDDEELVGWQSSLKKLTLNNGSEFKFILFNINSLINKLFNFNIILNQQWLDMVIFEESKLEPAISDDILKYPGYTTIRRDRSIGHGGGIVILFKSCYQPQVIHIDESFESVVISCMINNNKVNFIVCYNPRLSFPGFYGHLEDLLKKVNLHYSTLIIGDLNHDFLTDKADNLKRIMKIYNFTNMVNKPTRVRDNSSTLIDVILSNSKIIVS